MRASGWGPSYRWRRPCRGLYSPRTVCHVALTDANGNFERYKNADVDKLLDGYATAASEDQQISMIKQISAHMLQDLPFIPVTESADWFQYNTKNFGGWPTSDNPYAQPSAYNYPDNEQVLLHLYYKPAQ